MSLHVQFWCEFAYEYISLMRQLNLLLHFASTLIHCHSSVQFTMEIEHDGSLPFLGVELLNRAPRIESNVYIKPTNTGLLLHYQSHVDNRYKRSLINTDYLGHFHEECDRLREVFSKLKYQQHLINTAIKKLIDTKVSDQTALSIVTRQYEHC